MNKRLETLIALDESILLGHIPERYRSGEVPNDRRAWWAVGPLNLFAGLTFNRSTFASLLHDDPDDDAKDCMADLICDILHLAHILGNDTDALVEQALSDFREELAEEVMETEEAP